MANGPDRLRYIPELDGIRAAAILMVLVSHTGLHADGGLLGVDVFFALSGFLITGLLVSEANRYGAFDIPHFYARRALRLLPPLAVVIVLVALLQPSARGVSTSLGAGIPIVVFYMTNWAVGFAHFPMGYFAHLWSLAVEEQFYLVWPLVLRAWLRLPGLAARLAAVGAAMTAARIVAALLHVHAVDVITPLRADGLLYGAALAVFVFRDGQRARLRPLATPLAAWAAAAAIGLAAVVVSTFPRVVVWRSIGQAVAGMAAAVLIAHVLAVETSAVKSMLSWAPAVAVGRVSYGIYLFHYPIFTWASHRGWPDAQVYLVEYAAMIAVVLASWHLVEKPALRLKRHFEPAPAQGRAEALSNASYRPEEHPPGA